MHISYLSLPALEIGWVPTKKSHPPHPGENAQKNKIKKKRHFFPGVDFWPPGFTQSWTI